MANKRCNKCEERKPLDEFYNSKTNRDGKYAACKKCHNARVIARQKERYATDAAFRQRKRDYAREYARKRYADDPAYRQRQRDYARRYYHETRQSHEAQRLEPGEAYARHYWEAGASPVIDAYSDLVFASNSMAVRDQDEEDAISALCLMVDEDLTLDTICDRHFLSV